MADRIPTAAEAADLAATLKANGYPPSEAAHNFRVAYGRGEAEVDGCLMFEGEHIAMAEAIADQWGGLTEDERETALSSWLNTVTHAALMTLAAEGGESEAIRWRDEELAYCAEHW